MGFKLTSIPNIEWQAIFIFIVVQIINVVVSRQFICKTDKYYVDKNAQISNIKVKKKNNLK